MPIVNYLVTFYPLEGEEPEIYYYQAEEEARNHFSLFGPDDSDLYSRITLSEFSWHPLLEEQETIIEELELA